MLDLTANRFESADRIAIVGRIQATIATWGPTYVGQWSDVQSLERVAAHAIGCTAYDLRDSELEEITSHVLRLLKLERRISGTADRRAELRASFGRRHVDACNRETCIHSQDQDRREYVTTRPAWADRATGTVVWDSERGWHDDATRQARFEQLHGFDQ